jgi:DNA-binding transcriptional regulator YhcF (GntR family)
VKDEILLTEQPPVYTDNGQVEFVKASDEDLIEESQDKSTKKAKKKLIVETPLESAEIR